MDNCFYQGLQFGLGLCVAGFIMMTICSFLNSYDSTDEAGKRSGVKIVTDAKTGMQYLRTSGGGITPRVDADGKQLRAER